MKDKCPLSHSYRKVRVNCLEFRQTAGLVFVSEVRANLMGKGHSRLVRGCMNQKL